MSNDDAMHPATHDREQHWFACGHCGYVGTEDELPDDPDGHPCGKDECPSCGKPGYISCCYLSEQAAIERDEEQCDA